MTTPDITSSPGRGLVWTIVDKVDFDQAPVPEWVTETERLIAACSEHEWELELYGEEDDNDVSLGCAKCPAGVDDLYVDGHWMIYLDLNEVMPGVQVEEGKHNSPVPLIAPVTVSIVTRHHSTPNGEDWDVEMFVELRGPVRLVEYGEQDPEATPQDALGFPT